MGLITIQTTTYLTVFASGTFVGAAAVLLCNRFHQRWPFNRKNGKNLETIPLEERYQFPELKDEYRLVIAVRNDLKMQKGKVAAQCGHASIAAYKKCYESNMDLLQKWLQFGGTKITVKVDSEEELMALADSAKSAGVLASVVRDAGQTQVAPGSKTVVAIGPAPKSTLDLLTGHLKLY